MSSGEGRSSRILVTGFGPFPGVAVNRSGALSEQVAEAAHRAFPGVRATPIVLPTEWQAGPAVLAAALARTEPDIALHFGVSSRAHGFVVETVGRNRCRLKADAAGAGPASADLSPEGPASLSCAPEARRIAAALRRLDLPVSLSSDAGDYLCNAVFFHSLAAAAAGGGRRVAFIHIPVAAAAGRAAGTAAGRGLCDKSLVAGGLAALAVMAGRQPAPPDGRRRHDDGRGF
ncbi:MAG: pyroglutamyl-peptidase I [Hyphomicrobiaceae bacterium]